MWGSGLPGFKGQVGHTTLPQIDTAPPETGISSGIFIMLNSGKVNIATGAQSRDMKTWWVFMTYD